MCAQSKGQEFAKKEISALMGVRSKLEALLFKEGVTPTVIEPDMTGIVRRKWAVGMAWHENSRDLGYALGMRARDAQDERHTRQDLQKLRRYPHDAQSPDVR